MACATPLPFKLFLSTNRRSAPDWTERTGPVLSPAELASGPEHENSYTLALIVFRRGDIGMRLASDNFIP
jgi:hypothetical protein